MQEADAAGKVSGGDEAGECPWSELESLIEPHYTKEGNGRPPAIGRRRGAWFVTYADTAARRKRLIAGLEKAGDPLFADFTRAAERATAATRTARENGEYQLLSGGDVNIYSLFVERAFALVKPNGMVGLSTPWESPPT